MIVKFISTLHQSASWPLIISSVMSLIQKKQLQKSSSSYSTLFVHKHTFVHIFKLYPLLLNLLWSSLIFSTQDSTMILPMNFFSFKINIIPNLLKPHPPTLFRFLVLHFTCISCPRVSLTLFQKLKCSPRKT